VQLALAKAQGQLRGERPDALATLAYLQFLAGNLVGARTAIEEARLELGQLDPNSFAFVFVPLVDGEISLALKEYERTVEQAEGLIIGLRNLNMRPFLADAYTLKGEALMALGRGKEAREVLQQARAEAEALGSRRILWRILLALSRVEQENGDQTEAERLGAQARETVHRIADHAGSEALRASFLKLSQIRALLASG